MTKTRTRFLRRALVVAIAMTVAGVAHAQTINISTGTNGSGVVLGDSAADPFWLISVAGGAFGQTRTLFPADQCCGMGSVNTLEAKWISNVTNSQGPVGTGWNNNPYTVFRRSFDLTGYDLNTVALSGLWRVADGITGAYLNGNFLFASPAIVNSAQVTTNWGADNPFAVAMGSSFFTTGVNTLEFHAETLNGVYDGLYVDADVVGTITPEPSSVMLMATGLLAIAGAAVRRRRA